MAIIILGFCLLAFGILPTLASNPDQAFQKFAVRYPPYNGNIGFANQVEIDLNLTSRALSFAAGVPVNVSAAGGVFAPGFDGHLENVTITFNGANSYQSQPGSGVSVGGAPPIAGVVLYPVSQCYIHANGVIFSQPYLCGYPNNIVWSKAGTYHPFLVINFNNGTAPLTENLTSDVVTVVAAPEIIALTDNFGSTTTQYVFTAAQPDNTPLYVAIAILLVAVFAGYFGTGERLLEVITHKKERRKVKNDWKLLYRMAKRWFKRRFPPKTKGKPV
jgi:hypothetical protein